MLTADLGIRPDRRQSPAERECLLAQRRIRRCRTSRAGFANALAPSSCWAMAALVHAIGPDTRIAMPERQPQ